MRTIHHVLCGVVLTLGLAQAGCKQTEDNKPAVSVAAAKAEKPLSETKDPQGNLVKVYHVDGMTCEHCEETIVKGLQSLPGVVAASASNKEARVTVTVKAEGGPNDQAVAELAKKNGFVVMP